MNTQVNTFRVLVYGDSITFGRAPGKHERYDNQTRWPGVLQTALGDTYEVIEEALRARMLRGENPFIGDRDGYKQFGPILASHLPVDLLVIMLGTNDASSVSPKSPEKIAEDLRSYFAHIQQWCTAQDMPFPQIMVAAPPVTITARLNEHTRSVYPKAEGVTMQLPSLYRTVATAQGALFYDASAIDVSFEDGVHLDALGHQKLGNGMAAFIKEHAVQPGNSVRSMASEVSF